MLNTIYTMAAERRHLFSVTIQGYDGKVDTLGVDKWHAIDIVYNMYSAKYPNVQRKDYNATKKKL